MIVQFGGQTPLNLALPLKAAGVPIIGTSPESIDLAEDRKRFGKLLDELDIPQPPGGTAPSIEGALEVAESNRLSGTGSSLVRTWRARHGHRLRRQSDRQIHEGSGRVFTGTSNPDRPLSRGRD